MLAIDKLNELNKCENGGKCESCNFSIDGLCHIDIIEDALKYRQALEIVYNAISKKFNNNNKEKEEVSVTFNKQFKSKLEKLLNPQVQEEKNADSDKTMVNTVKDEVKPVVKTKINDLYYMEDIEKVIAYPVGHRMIKTNEYTNAELKGFERLKMMPVNRYSINGYKPILDKDVKFEVSTNNDFETNQVKVVFKNGNEKIIDIYYKFKVTFSDSDPDEYMVLKADNKEEAIDKAFELVKKWRNDIDKSKLRAIQTYDDLTI